MAVSPVCRTVGIEVELLAPVGSHRKQLAEQIAKRIGGRVHPFFHFDSEPSKVAGRPIFYHLTQGFEVQDRSGQKVALCVDDITLQRDLDKHAAPKAGWFRILSDDVRLLRLLMRHTPADSPLETCLDGLGALFGSTPSATDSGIYRLEDGMGASVALAAPLPGERERACELITAPLPADDRTTLPLLLGCAQELGFLLPNEGASHLHFDAQPFCSAPMLAATLLRLHTEREHLRAELNTNPYCRRLGACPENILELVRQDSFQQLEWEAARQRLLQLKPSKYCDFNIRNLLLGLADKNTLEVRILPTTLQASEIFAAQDFFQALFAQTQQLVDKHGRTNHPEQFPTRLVAALPTPTDYLAQPTAQTPGLTD